MDGIGRVLVDGPDVFRNGSSSFQARGVRDERLSVLLSGCISVLLRHGRTGKRAKESGGGNGTEETSQYKLATFSFQIFRISSGSSADHCDHIELSFYSCDRWSLPDSRMQLAIPSQIFQCEPRKEGREARAYLFLEYQLLCMRTTFSHAMHVITKLSHDGVESLPLDRRLDHGRQ